MQKKGSFKSYCGKKLVWGRSLWHRQNIFALRLANLKLLFKIFETLQRLNRYSKAAENLQNAHPPPDKDFKSGFVFLVKKLLQV